MDVSGRDESEKLEVGLGGRAFKQTTETLKMKGRKNGTLPFSCTDIFFCILRSQGEVI